MRLQPTTPEGAQQALATMWTIRLFEEALEELFNRGVMHGTMHLSIGQEASATGACGALDDGDFITSTHRGHGHGIAHGADPERMLAELLARETGYCRGRGGSMHIADVAAGNLGANGIVAGSIALAAGAAFVQQQRGTGKVVMCFFGDGAVNEGTFHEALNLASIWQLPVVFVCENNQYGMSMASAAATAGESIAARGEGYGMPGLKVDGNDLVAVHEHSAEAVGRARDARGPTLLELQTYRYKGHSKSDRNLYRTSDEIEDWRSNRDPLMSFQQRAVQEDWIDEDAADAARAAARDRIRRAVQGATKAPRPEVTEAELEGAVYAS